MSLIYNSYLNDFFNDDYFGIGKSRGKQTNANNFNAKCNIYKQDNDFIFDLFLPGFSRDNFDIDIDNNILTVKGTLEAKEHKYIHQEHVQARKFERSFSLPKNVDIDNVDADYTSGVLSILVPTYENKKPTAKKININ